MKRNNRIELIGALALATMLLLAACTQPTPVTHRGSKYQHSGTPPYSSVLHSNAYTGSTR